MCLNGLRDKSNRRYTVRAKMFIIDYAYFFQRGSLHSNALFLLLAYISDPMLQVNSEAATMVFTDPAAFQKKINVAVQRSVE